MFQNLNLDIFSPSHTIFSQVLKYFSRHCLRRHLVTQAFTLRLNICQRGNVVICTCDLLNHKNIV